MNPYYQDASVTIYHADSRDVTPDDCVMVTDPPYGLDFPYLEYSDTRESLVDLIGDVLVPNIENLRRSVILCGVTQIDLYPHPHWICCATWNTTGSFGKYGYNQWMPILCYGQDLKGFGNVNGVTKGDTLHISGGGSVGFQRNKEEKKHTCPKPLNIMEWIVQRTTLPTDVVYDPFMGSGTTIVAAKSLGRKSVGVEIEERYCEIAVRRLAAA
jgi:23S rRNA G2445 N2-methylase RlmL